MRNIRGRYVLDSEKDFFGNNGTFAYAWCGGRWLIITKELEVIDFGSGNSQPNRSATIDHNILGAISGFNDTLKFLEHDCEIDFSTVNNSWCIDGDKIKHIKGDSPWELYVPIHLMRYAKKHLK